MIEWKGLFANTPYSSANNKTQDDAVTGMQDTIYATGPGYGAYRAIARVHNQSGAVVAEIPLSSGGGQLSAPPPVRILDDSTTYSYSLQVVEGAIPPGDADGVVIRIIGGSAKRFPVALTQTPSGAFSLAGPLLAPTVNRGIVVVGSSSGNYGPNPGILQASTNGNYSMGPAFGPMSWGMAFANPALPFLANYAVGSTVLADQEAQMAQARLVAPSHLVFFCGSNDVYANVAATTIWATLRGWAEECIQWGGIPILVAPFARTTTSAAQAAALTKLRTLITDFCARQTAPAYMIDALGIVAQPGSATLAPKSDYIDTAGGVIGIHLTNAGAVAVGDSIATLLQDIAPTRPDVLPIPGYETDATGLEMLSNPQLLGTNGALPTGWTDSINGAGATLTYTNVAKSNGHNALRLTFTAAASGNYIQLTQSGVPGRVPAGSWATAGIKIKVVSGGEYLRNCQLSIPLSTGDANTAAVMTQAGTEANRRPFTALNGRSFWLHTGRWRKIDASSGRFGLTFTAISAGEIVIEVEMPYTRLSEDGWPQ